MRIIENFSLKNYNSFKIDVSADRFVELNSEEEIFHLINEKLIYRFAQQEIQSYLILGNGCNILFTKDFNGTVIKINNKGIQIVKETQAYVYIKVSAGEDWDSFVIYCIQNNFFGIENLSMIPGTVGAAPVQNIGAYGVEIKDVFHQLEAIDIATGEIKTFSRQECRFGYRDSIFKHKLKNLVIILSVTLKLAKRESFNYTYADLRKEIDNLHVDKPTAEIIRDIVCKIRGRKLPCSPELGSAGSFFKNPVINETEFKELLEKFPDLRYYSLPHNKYKLPAAWLIERCGWKGKRIGNIGVHEFQPLVIVNYGNASGSEINTFAEQIKKDVFDKFRIPLEYEVNIV